MRDYGASRARKLSNWKHENKVSQWTLFDVIASQDVTFSNKVFQVYNQYYFDSYIFRCNDWIDSMYNETSETKMY